jgi:hypothetical protein
MEDDLSMDGETIKAIESGRNADRATYPSVSKFTYVGGFLRWRVTYVGTKANR